MSTSLRVLDSRRVGTGEHLKLRISDGVETWDAIGFRQGDRVSDATVGSDIDVIYQMERNTWNGRTRLQLVIDDLARSQKPTLT
jgi:single-stranded-DNA-specific exonuclease